VAAGIRLADDAVTNVRSFDAIDEVLALAESGAGMPPVGGIEDIEEISRRSMRGEVLDLDELRTARSTLAALADLSEKAERRYYRGVAAMVGAFLESERRQYA